MRSELGHERTGRLYQLFQSRIPRKSDLVCYWFEKAREQIAGAKTNRAGLIATNSIRGGANRVVIDRVKTTGDIFCAWSDEQWILDGAAVRVSIVAFDDGSERIKTLNGEPVRNINSDLTSRDDISKARRLRSRAGMASEGVKPSGPFDIPEDVAQQWLSLPNPSGVSNRDVVKQYIGGRDITQKPSRRWIVDFNQMERAEAEKYEVPFRYVAEKVQPVRATNKRAHRREKWWLFGESYPLMRRGIEPLARFIAISAVSKHRNFVWIPGHVLPANSLITIAADDDLTYGLLNSRVHEVWSLAQGTSLEDRPRYTPLTTFETFPFPETTEEQHQAISGAAKHLDDVRNHLLKADSSLTMTKLYNELASLKDDRDPTARAFPLLLAHERLDQAVATAYGWEWPLPDEEILGRLLELNLSQSVGGVGEEPDAESQTES